MDVYLAVWKKFADFNGRARRREYWTFALVNVGISIALSFLDVASGMTSDSGQGVLSGIFSLAILVPTIAVGVRRMHDTGHSGWWLIVPIVNLVFALTDSEAATNAYGPNPKAASA